MRSVRNRIVAGNWKMHGSRALLTSYVQDLARELDDLKQARQQQSSVQTGTDEVSVVICPPTGYLALLADLLHSNGLAKQIQLGAQDVNPHSQGAFTGETSAAMLRDLGARWVLVGHSERRQYQAETDELVAAKTAAALSLNLTPVICVGESEAQREAGEAEQVVASQLAVVIENLGASALADCVVAYEPVWAIGTGRTATAEIAQSMHAAIRERLAGWCGEAAERIPLLYGGSVKSSNAAQLFAQQDIDGGLIGGASLDAREFAGIIAAAGAGNG